MNTVSNQVTLIGRVGGDPEIRSLENGNTVAKINLATNYSYKNKAGELTKETDWHSITVWGPLTKLVSDHIKKGSLIAVFGRLTYNTYEDKDGNKRTSSEIKVNDISLL